MKKENKEAGFTLIEILIVIVIIAVITGLAVLGYQKVVRGTKDKLAQTRLAVIAEAQSRFRVGMGRGRYATLRELSQTTSNTGERLVPNSILTFTTRTGIYPAVIDGWGLYEERSNLRTQFGVVLYKTDYSTNTYCVYEDGILRKGPDSVPTNCTRTSAPLD